jgi:hypothetical protein
VVAGRAACLQTSRAQVPQDSGTSALLPGWADLRIYLSADFDVGSAITLAFGIKAFWVEPFANRAGGKPATRAWPAEVLVVDRRNLEAEERELIALLDRIASIFEEARRRSRDTTVQLYLWDRVEYEHLSRVVGRHLPAILAKRSIQHLAWLFPPDNVVGNAAMVVRRSTLTIVRDVVRALLAAPVPHYYTLLEVARAYHTSRLEERYAAFDVHPLFEDNLSDQIPSERAHEIWSKCTKPSRHWVRQLASLDRAVRTRLRALEEVAGRLRDDLRGTLKQQAPTLRTEPIGPPPRAARVSVDGQLWYAHARLNAALAELDVRQTRAMPAHEREARFRAARLEQRLTGPAETAALRALGLPLQAGRRVYRLAATSAQVRAKESDFAWALAPASDPDFLDQALCRLVDGTRLDPGDWRRWRPMEEYAGVVIRALDRDRRLLVVDPGWRAPRMLDDLEAEGLADFSADVMLDPVHEEFFTAKLLEALQAIGNPTSAITRPLVALATGMSGRPQARRTPDGPTAEVLWRAAELADTPVPRALGPAREWLTQHGLALNPSQWAAWQAALSRRLQLMWGPPGTGKSRTVRAVITGAVVEACQTGRPLRVLVCAPTYPAMDNVLLPVADDLAAMPGDRDVIVRRLRSSNRPLDAGVDPRIDLPLEPGGTMAHELRDRLEAADTVTVVGAVPQQVHNLLMFSGGPAMAGLFDLIIIDEASQLDVAQAILALCALAEGGAVVVAGDHRQLAPIHQAEPPLGLEAMVGSVFEFFVAVHGLDKQMLTVNYRSNATIVGFVLQAGYESTLTAHAPDLTLELLAPLPGAPAGLAATAALDAGMVGPARPQPADQLLRLPGGPRQPVERVRGRRGRQPAVAAAGPARQPAAGGPRPGRRAASARRHPLHDHRVLHHRGRGRDPTPRPAGPGRAAPTAGVRPNRGRSINHPRRGRHRRTVSGPAARPDGRQLRPGRPGRDPRRGRVPAAAQPLQRDGLPGPGQAGAPGQRGGGQAPVQRPRHAARLRAPQGLRGRLLPHRTADDARPPRGGSRAAGPRHLQTPTLTATAMVAIRLDGRSVALAEIYAPRWGVEEERILRYEAAVVGGWK